MGGGDHKVDPRIGRGQRALRRYVIASLILLLATLTVAAPAAATHGYGKWGPALRFWVSTNDDGSAGRLDPGDVGGISAAYDRWGYRSSDDPTEAGMNPTRIDSDVARCKTVRLDSNTVRVKIQNAYPGYSCTFAAVTINRSGRKLVVDDVTVDIDQGLELVELEGPESGDFLKNWRRLLGIYAVTVLQEAPQGEALDFEIEVSFVERHPRPPFKCCVRCWR
jgi:hypothetical protein